MSPKIETYVAVKRRMRDKVDLRLRLDNPNQKALLAEAIRKDEETLFMLEQQFDSSDASQWRSLGKLPETGAVNG